MVTDLYTDSDRYASELDYDIRFMFIYQYKYNFFYLDAEITHLRRMALRLSPLRADCDSWSGSQCPSIALAGSSCAIVRSSQQ